MGKSNDMDYKTEGIISTLRLLELRKDNIIGQSYLSTSRNAEIRRETKMDLIDCLMDGGCFVLLPEYYHEAYKGFIIDLLENSGEF